MADRPLTPKQELFAAKYVRHLDATRAAKEAGYSPRTARQQGHQLLKDPRISEAVQKANRERVRQVSIDTDMVLRELATIATSDITEFLSEVDATDGGKVIALKDMDELRQSGLARAIQAIEQRFTKDGDRVFKLRLHPKTPSLEMLGKYLRMWQDSKDAAAGSTEKRIIIRRDCGSNRRSA